MVFAPKKGLKNLAQGLPWVLGLSPEALKGRPLTRRPGATSRNARCPFRARHVRTRFPGFTRVNPGLSSAGPLGQRPASTYRYFPPETPDQISNTLLRGNKASKIHLNFAPFWSVPQIFVVQTDVRPDLGCHEIGSTVPLGRGYFPDDPRHFVPGYYRAVPPGQKPFAHQSASSSVSKRPGSPRQ